MVGDPAAFHHFNVELGMNLSHEARQPLHQQTPTPACAASSGFEVGRWHSNVSLKMIHIHCHSEKGDSTPAKANSHSRFWRGALHSLQEASWGKYKPLEVVSQAQAANQVRIKVWIEVYRKFSG
jgi:hypothetical protein